MNDSFKGFEVIKSLSLAVITLLSKRGNDLGMIPVDIDGLNKVYGLRRNIIDNIVSNYSNTDKKYVIDPSSYLNNIVDSNLGEYPERIAGIVEFELLLVKNEIIPTINSVVEKVSDRLATLADSDLKSEYVVKYVKGSTILNLLEDSDLKNWFKSEYFELGKLDSKFPSLPDMTAIRNILLTGNPIVDDAIEGLLRRKKDEKWVELYNLVYTDLSDTTVLNSFETDRFSNIDEATFIYLVCRSFRKKIPFKELNGTSDAINISLARLSDWLCKNLSNTIMYLRNYYDSDRLIVENKDNTILVMSSVMSKHKLDIDTIIGATIQGVSDIAKIVEQQVELKNLYAKTNRMYMLEKSNNLMTGLKTFIMSIFDEMNDSLVNNYTENRRMISTEIFEMEVLETNIDNIIDVVRSKVLNIILQNKYSGSNAKFIMDRMTHYLNRQDRDSLDFVAVSDFVALEMVVRYLINTHIVVEPEPVDGVRPYNLDE